MQWGLTQGFAVHVGDWCHVGGVHVCMHAGCDVVRLAMLTPDNKLGPEGAKALAPSLEQLKQLTTLDLQGE